MIRPTSNLLAIFGLLSAVTIIKAIPHCKGRISLEAVSYANTKDPIRIEYTPRCCEIDSFSVEELKKMNPTGIEMSYTLRQDDDEMEEWVLSSIGENFEHNSLQMIWPSNETMAYIALPDEWDARKARDFSIMYEIKVRISSTNIIYRDGPQVCFYGSTTSTTDFGSMRKTYVDFRCESAEDYAQRHAPRPTCGCSTNETPHGWLIALVAVVPSVALLVVIILAIHFVRKYKKALDVLKTEQHINIGDSPIS